jgi:hypothetical protein
VAAQRFTRAAARLVRLLGEECAIAGGLAVNAHGYVRATRDVDLIVSIPLDDARRRLEKGGVRTTLFRGDVIEGGFHCLKGSLGGVPFDVLPPLVPIERERLIVLDLHGLSLPVVDFETLARLKLRAGGPKDLLDLAVLVNLRPERRRRTLELAAADPQLQGRLVAFIDDPRVKRQVAETKLEARLGQRTRGKRRPPPERTADDRRASGQGRLSRGARRR